MLLVVYGIIFFLISFLIAQYIPGLKGRLGERRVSKTFEKLQLDGYKIINDLLISNTHGTSQIDHVILSPYGIFVVETKTYKGWIYGNEFSDNWTQVIYKYKNSFKNPIKQNYGHIAALKGVLKEYRNINYIPIIVFAGSAELKKVDTKTDVIYPEGLFGTIMMHRGIECLNISDVESIYNRLNSITLRDRKTKKAHVKNIKTNLRNYEKLIMSKICPKCKGALVLRSGRYGEFIGCSNYPRCKFRETAH